MEASTIIDATQRGLMLVLLLSLPAVLTAAAVGLLVAIFQATTQIQDQSIAQALKLVAVILVLLLAAKWMSNGVFNFASELFNALGMPAMGTR